MTSNPPPSKETEITTPPEENKLEQRHLLGQLFAAITARHRDEEGRLCIGIKQNDLLQSLHTNKTGLTRLLDLLRQEITPLGMELVEYRLGRETHYCIRTLYGVPSELTDSEYAVLGVIIATIESASKRRRPRRISAKEIETVLVARGRLSRYHLDRIFRRLIELGYIIRTARRIAYGPRLELEFDAERREAIGNAATIYLAGTATTSMEGESS